MEILFENLVNLDKTIGTFINKTELNLHNRNFDVVKNGNYNVLFYQINSSADEELDPVFDILEAVKIDNNVIENTGIEN